MDSPTARPSAAPRAYALPPPLRGDAAVDAFRDVCHALGDGPLDVLSVEPAVVVANVRAGVEAVVPRLGEVVALRPRTDVAAILSLPDLARAVEHAAASCVAAPRVARAAIDARYAALRPLREAVLLSARALASPAVGLLPAAQVDAIAKGRGVYDHARDGVALASLFRANAAALAGRHPCTDAQLDALEAHGAWLTDHVAPRGARVRRRRPPAMADTRDRLWTLLRRRHEALRLAGIELFGERGVDARVPRLGVRAKAPARPG